MQHIAIMKKSWKLTEKILSGKKKIESRWYKNKSAPWNNIKPGETIYFKDSGSPVTIKAKVKNVKQFSHLSPAKVNEILKCYSTNDGIEKEDYVKFFETFKDKNYCMLIFLEAPERVTPFEINKSGFGIMSAWICVENVNKLKI